MSDNAKIAIIAKTSAQQGDGFSVAEATASIALRRVSRQLFDVGAALKSCKAEAKDFSKAVSGIDDPSLIVLVQAEDQPQGVLVLDPLLVNALIELSTGAGERQVFKERRAPTLIDAALTRAFCDSFLASLPGEQAGLYDNATLPRLRYHAFETDPARLPFVLPGGAYGVVSGDLEFQSGARGGSITLALPLRLWSGEGPRLADPNSTWAKHLSIALKDAPLKLRAVLERIEMPLSEAGALAVGDILPVAAASISNLTLEDCDANALLRGRLGQIAGRKAIAITGSPVKGLLRKPPELHASTFPTNHDTAPHDDLSQIQAPNGNSIAPAPGIEPAALPQQADLKPLSAPEPELPTPR